MKERRKKKEGGKREDGRWSEDETVKRKRNEEGTRNIEKRVR
jgi:hypothetical protein